MSKTQVNIHHEERKEIKKMAKPKQTIKKQRSRTNREEKEQNYDHWEVAQRDSAVREGSTRRDGEIVRPVGDGSTASVEHPGAEKI